MKLAAPNDEGLAIEKKVLRSDRKTVGWSSSGDRGSSGKASGQKNQEQQG
jgi:hypothetical protein